MVKTFLRASYKIKCKFLERLSLCFPVPKDRVRVHHGAEPWGIGGPYVKLQRMQKYFPDYLVRYNIIYSVSAIVSSTVCATAQKKGVKIVQHINSLWNPIYRPDYNEKNKPFKEIYELADHVVFGSNHAKKSAEIFLGKCRAPYTIIYNSINMSHFTLQKRPNNRFNILSIGVHSLRHRIEPLIRAMPYVNKEYPNAKLIIAGLFKKGEGIWDCSMKDFERLARELSVKNLEFLPEFTQEEAPSIYALGDILAHIMHMDWTPNTVIESMACGLPILHTGNGGLPEIVGEAGLSLDMPFDWNKIHTPEPKLLAERIMQLYEIRKEKGEIARETAVERYDLKDWARKHHQIFENLLIDKLS